MMKQALIQYLENWVKNGRGDQFGLVGVLQQQYGFSVILENKTTKNRFVPNILPLTLVQKALIQNNPQARAALDRELETSLVKELISG